MPPRRETHSQGVRLESYANGEGTRPDVGINFRPINRYLIDQLFSFQLYVLVQDS